MYAAAEATEKHIYLDVLHKHLAAVPCNKVAERMKKIKTAPNESQ